MSGFAGFFGSGTGPLGRVSPAVRLMVGALLLATVLVAPAIRWPGPAVMVLTAGVAIGASGVPLRFALRALALGLFLYAPLAALLSAPTLLPLLSDALAARGDPGAGRELLTTLGADPALVRAAGMVLRGVCALMVTIATISTIGARDVHPALGALPLPRLVRLILLQVVQQTGMLLDESRRVREAVALRSGGAASSRALIPALPAAWLPRVAGRAERVASAMDARGYTAAPLPPISGPGRWSAVDVAALGVAAATLAGVVLLAVRGG